MDFTDGCFKAVVFLSDSKIPFEFKYVLVDNAGNQKWESGENRVYRQYSAGQLVAVSTTMDFFRL